jgi:hypothetical protein
MKRFRSFGFALWLALALLVGQQAAALHELGHATAEFKQDKGSPAGGFKCQNHFLFAPFAGAVGTHCPAPLVAAPEIIEAPVHQAFAPAATRFVFQSRAPPAIL